MLVDLWKLHEVLAGSAEPALASFLDLDLVGNRSVQRVLAV
jgi:hypothetical protein